MIDRYKIGKNVYTNSQHQQSSSYTLKNNFIKKPCLSLQKIKLTKQETRCLKLYLQGMTMKEIGKQIFRSHRTIETHIKNIKEKLNANSRSAVFNKAKKLIHWDILNQNAS